MADDHKISFKAELDLQVSKAKAAITSFIKSVEKSAELTNKRTSKNNAVTETRAAYSELFKSLRKDVKDLNNDLHIGPVVESFRRAFHKLKEDLHIGPVVESFRRAFHQAIPAVAQEFKNLRSDIGKLTGKYKEVSTAAKTSSAAQTSAFTKSSESIAQLQERLEKLQAEYKGYAAYIADVDMSTPYSGDDVVIQRAQYLRNEIANIKSQLAGYNTEVEESGNITEEAGRKGASGFKQVNSAIKGSIQNVLRLRAAFRQVYNSNKQVVNSIKNGWLKVVNALKQVVSLTKQAVTSSKGWGKVSGIFKSNSKSADDYGKSLQRLTKTFIKYAFGVRSFFFLYRKIRKAVTEGLGSLALVDPNLNATISNFLTALNTLRGALASAFSPIITVVGPILTKLIGWLTDATNAIGMFIARLTGKSTYLKAVSVQQDYAQSLQDTADSARDAADATKYYLSGLDEIRKWDDGKDSGSGGSGGGGGGGTDPTQGLQWEEVEIPDPIKNFADALKSYFENEDWEGLGEFLAEKVNSIFEKLYTILNWENIGPKVTPVIDAITTTFNSLVDNINWDLIGRTFGTGLNSLVEIIDRFVTQIDTFNLGTKLSELLNGFVDEINWDRVGQTVGDTVQAYWELWDGFFGGIHWDELGSAVASAINGFFEKYKFSTTTGAIVKFINGLFSALKSIATDTKWNDIATNIANGINTAIKDFKWKDNGEALGLFLNNLFSALTNLLGSIQWKDIGSGIAGFINGFFEKYKFSTTTGALVTFMNGLFDTLGSLAADLHWQDIAQNIVDGINNFVKNFKWKENGEKLNAFLQNLADALAKIAEDTDWEGLGKGIADFLAEVEWFNLLGKAAKAIATALGGLLKGLASQPEGIAVIAAIAGWFTVTNVMPIANAIATAFGAPSIAKLLGNAIGKALGSGAGAAAVESAVGAGVEGAVETGAVNAGQTLVPTAEGGAAALGGSEASIVMAANDVGATASATWAGAAGMAIALAAAYTLGKVAINHFTQAEQEGARTSKTTSDNYKTVHDRIAELIQKFENGTATTKDYTELLELQAKATDTQQKATKGLKDDTVKLHDVQGQLNTLYDQGTSLIGYDGAAGSMKKWGKEVKDVKEGTGELNEKHKLLTKSIQNNKSTYATATNDLNTIKEALKGIRTQGLKIKDEKILTLEAKIDVRKLKIDSIKKYILSELDKKELAEGISTKVTIEEKLKLKWDEKNNKQNIDEYSKTYGKPKGYVEEQIRLKMEKDANIDAQTKAVLAENLLPKEIIIEKVTLKKTIKEQLEKSVNMGGKVEAPVVLKKAGNLKSHDTVTGVVNTKAWKGKDAVEKGVEVTKAGNIKSHGTVAGVVNTSGWLGGAVEKAVKLAKQGWITVQTWAEASKGGTVSIPVSLYMANATKLYNDIQAWYNSVVESFGFKLTKSSSGAILPFASGGVFKTAGQAIHAYASGTTRPHGTMFVAGEAGPEVIGHINGQTEILNKSQLAEAMYRAVKAGMADIINKFSTALSAVLNYNTNAILGAISRLSNINIPAIATGASLPANNSFLSAMNNSSQSEGISEDRLRNIVREETQRNVNYEFTAQINRRTLFDEFIQEAKLRQRQTGRNPLEFA